MRRRRATGRATSISTRRSASPRAAIDADQAAEPGDRLSRAADASIDGNTVELSTEQTLFAENAVQYRTTLSFLEGRIATIRRALKGE